MDPATKRWLFIALLIASVGLAACVVRTRPAHRHQSVQAHEKHKKQKHKKHKKHHKHR